ncbi:MAG: hypothetical protein IPK05_04670 [Comamonadaceae bacterium]|nr:hypothetical protein [Comamonadaceae bacterium]
MTHRDYCGSGGCSTFLFKKSKSTGWHQVASAFGEVTIGNKQVNGYQTLIVEGKVIARWWLGYEISCVFMDGKWISVVSECAMKMPSINAWEKGLTFQVRRSLEILPSRMGARIAIETSSRLDIENTFRD